MVSKKKSRKTGSKPSSIDVGGNLSNGIKLIGDMTELAEMVAKTDRTLIPPGISRFARQISRDQERFNLGVEKGYVGPDSDIDSESITIINDAMEEFSSKISDFKMHGNPITIEEAQSFVKELNRQVE